MSPPRATSGPARSRETPILLLLEYALLTAGLPLLYLLDWMPLPPIPALWILTLVCLTILVVSGDFKWRRLWNTRKLRRRLLLAAAPVVLAAPFLLLITAIVAPERMFGLIRERPLMWAAIMLFYPVLSVYPQGIVYRAFIFHRYRRLFGRGWTRILASALAFSSAHLIFENWIAPLLTLIGGILFAWTYQRTRSALVVTVQHALFGCFLFTIGLGWYFYWGVAG